MTPVHFLFLCLLVSEGIYIYIYIRFVLSSFFYYCSFTRVLPCIRLFSSSIRGNISYLINMPKEQQQSRRKPVAIIRDRRRARPLVTNPMLLTTPVDLSIFFYLGGKLEHPKGTSML